MAVWQRWELCAFNNLCRDKYERLGMQWEFNDTGLMTAAELEQIGDMGKIQRAGPCKGLCHRGCQSWRINSRNNSGRAMNTERYPHKTFSEQDIIDLSAAMKVGILGTVNPAGAAAPDAHHHPDGVLPDAHGVGAVHGGNQQAARAAKPKDRVHGDGVG